MNMTNADFSNEATIYAKRAHTVNPGLRARRSDHGAAIGAQGVQHTLRERLQSIGNGLRTIQEAQYEPTGLERQIENVIRCGYTVTVIVEQSAQSIIGCGRGDRLGATSEQKKKQPSTHEGQYGA